MGHPSVPRSIASCTSSLQVSSSPSDPLAVHLLMLTAGPSRHNAAELLVCPNIQDLPHDVVEKVVRVLGVMVDYRLTWEDHIDYVRMRPTHHSLPVVLWLTVLATTDRR